MQYAALDAFTTSSDKLIKLFLILGEVYSLELYTPSKYKTHPNNTEKNAWFLHKIEHITSPLQILIF